MKANQRKLLGMSLLILLWGIPYSSGIIFTFLFLGEPYIESDSEIQLLDYFFWISPFVILPILYLLGTVWLTHKIEKNWDFTTKRHVIAQCAALYSMFIWAGICAVVMMEHYGVVIERSEYKMYANIFLYSAFFTGSMLVFSVWYYVLTKKKPEVSNLHRVLSYVPVCTVFATTSIVFILIAADCLAGCPV